MFDTRDLLEGMRGLDNATDAYVQRWTYYAGTLPETFSAERIRTLVEKSASAYRFRLSKIPVNALARRIGISGFTSTRGRSVVERIEAIRSANDMELYEPFLHTRLFVYGDAYLFVWPVSDEEDITQRTGEATDAPPDEEVRAVGVELAYQSPLSCRAFYDAEDGRRTRFVIRRWKEASPLVPDGIWRAEVWYADRLESWRCNPGATGVNDEDWFPYAEDSQGNEEPAIDGQNWPAAHDFEEIPFKHARTDLPYGRSELEDFIGPQNVITKATATQASEIESHGWRERYRIADDKAILDQANDVVNWTDNANAPAATATRRSGRRRGPGTEQILHGTKAVGEWSAPNPGDLIEPLEQWVRLGATASDTPLFEFDARTGQQMSGIARWRADAPMRAREKQAKAYLSRFWREVYSLALAMDGIGDAGEITVEWTLPEVVSDPEWWTTAQVRLAMGVPIKKILAEANYSDEEITEWIDAEGEEAFMDQRIARLAALGTAMQEIGAGASLLGIDNTRVVALVDRILGEAGAPPAIEGEPQL